MIYIIWVLIILPVWYRPYEVMEDLILVKSYAQGMKYENFRTCHNHRIYNKNEQF